MTVLTRFAALAALLAPLGACGPGTTATTATEAALCDEWAASLPTRSRSDTDQTQAEIGVLIDAFDAVCS